MDDWPWRPQNELSPRRRGYLVFKYGSDPAVPQIEDEGNPFDWGTFEHEDWRIGFSIAADERRTGEEDPCMRWNIGDPAGPSCPTGETR